MQQIAGLPIKIWCWNSFQFKPTLLKLIEKFIYFGTVMNSDNEIETHLDIWSKRLLSLFRHFRWQRWGLPTTPNLLLMLSAGWKELPSICSDSTSARPDDPLQSRSLNRKNWRNHPSLSSYKKCENATTSPSVAKQPCRNQHTICTVAVYFPSY